MGSTWLGNLWRRLVASHDHNCHQDCWRLEQRINVLQEELNQSKSSVAELGHRYVQIRDSSEALNQNVSSLRFDLEEANEKIRRLTEAIELNHVKKPDGTCEEKCWSCAIVETAKGVRVAEELMRK